MSIKIKILRKTLEKSNNKLNIFANKNILRKCDYNISELCNLIDTFLTDEEKAKLFEFEHLKDFQSSIFDLIKDTNLKLYILNNSEFLSNMDPYNIKKVIESLDEYGKVQILHNTDFLNKYEIDNYDIKKIMISLSDTTKFELLSDKDLIENQLHLDQYDFCDIVKSIQNEELKLQMLDTHKLNINQVTYILETCSGDCKVSSLLEHKYDFKKTNIIILLSSMNIDSLITFINEHNDFLAKNSISTYQITMQFDQKKQLEFVEKFENVDLPINEKRKILATLKQETKDTIDKLNYSEEYQTAIEMKLNKYDMITPKLDENLERYHDLEDLMYINPMDMSEEDKEKLPKLFEIFPNLKVSNFVYNTSTFEEFKNGEEWIKSVIQQLNPEWSDIQKVAFIDNAIGKKISYSPDFDTEIYDKKVLELYGK